MTSHKMEYITVFLVFQLQLIFFFSLYLYYRVFIFTPLVSG